MAPVVQTFTRAQLSEHSGRMCCATGAGNVQSQAQGLHTLLDSGHLRIVQLSGEARRDERHGSPEGRPLRKPLTVVGYIFEEDKILYGL